MSSHPINLGLRFFLEIGVLLVVGVWGWQKGEGWQRFALAFGVPIVLAILWATFRVQDDPGVPPVAIPGLLRLIFELAVFGFAVWTLLDIKLVTLSWVFGAVLTIHYITSYDRILWLIKQ